MNDSTAAYRLREQLKKFVGIVFPHVPKPQKEFLGQMFFGIQAGQTTVLSRIARALDVPDFFFYAIADGLRTLFSRHGRWNALDGPDKEPEEPCQMILAL